MSSTDQDLSITDLLRDLLDSLQNPATDRKAARRTLLEMEDTVIADGGKDAIPLLRLLSAERGWGVDCNRIIKQIERVGRGVQPLREVKPGEDLAGYPMPTGMPEGWVDPKGWRCTKSGILHGKDTGLGGYDWMPVTLAPIWIGERWEDVDTGQHHLKLCWPGGSEVVGRATAMQARELPALAGKGAPVSSRSAADVVGWLEAAEARNVDALPLAPAIGRLGWTGTGKGRKLQRGDGPMMLRASDGHESTAKSLQAVGDWESWVEAAKEVNQLPVPALMLASAVASLLLDTVGCPPFVVDLNGLSTRGKTTAMRWAISAFGDPRDTGEYLQSWSTTLAAIEGKAQFLRSFPLPLDDTKKLPIKQRDMILSVVMGWGSGHGKSRAKPDGVRKTAEWQSVLLSTGEAPLTRLAGEHVGMRLRVLSIQQEPIPQQHKAVGIIENLDSWGHLSARVERYVLSAEPQLRAHWEKKRAEMETTLNAGSSGRRLAGFTAAIECAIKVLMAIGVPFPVPIQVLDLLITACRTALSSADTTTESWHRVEAWLASNEGRISEQVGAKDETAPSQGWIGRAIGGDMVAVSPMILDGELRKMGYDPEEILPLWVKNGWLQTGDKGELAKPCRWMGKTARLYHLKGMVGWAGKVE